MNAPNLGTENPMTDKEILPCPFCGSADVEQRETVSDAVVACCNCGSRTGLVFLGPEVAANAYKMREQREIWNTRAIASMPHSEQVEAIRAAHRLLSELDESQRVGRFSRMEESDIRLVAEALTRNVSDKE